MAIPGIAPQSWRLFSMTGCILWVTSQQIVSRQKLLKLNLLQLLIMLISKRCSSASCFAATTSRLQQALTARRQARGHQRHGDIGDEGDGSVELMARSNDDDQEVRSSFCFAATTSRLQQALTARRQARMKQMLAAAAGQQKVSANAASL
jgi:hypothetical protein